MDEERSVNPLLAGLNPYEAALLEMIIAPVARTRVARENFCFIMGAKLIDNPETNPYLPKPVDRKTVKAEYGKTTTRYRVFREFEIQKAEELGIVDKLMKSAYMQALNEKIARQIAKASELHLLDVAKVMEAKNGFIDLEGGLSRRGYSQNYQRRY